MEIAAIVIVVFGLVAGTYGAYLIYQADYPRNDWIVEVLAKVSERPRYGTIAPNDYDPVAEKQAMLNRVNEVSEHTQKYAQKSKRGMGAILLGFVLQVVGNILLLWPFLKSLYI